MSDIEISPAGSLSSVELLRPILESAVRNPFTREIIEDEVNDDLIAVEGSINGDNDLYFGIAQNSAGTLLGMMGLRSPGTDMLAFASTDNPIEIINAYVLDISRGSGVGRALVRHLEHKAVNDGHTEVLLNSGPRYRFSGWPFWRRMYGEPIGVLKDYYGPSFDAKVWRSSLDKTK